MTEDLNGTYPYCYSITNNDWIGWIKEFTEAYKQINGRYPGTNTIPIYVVSRLMVIL